ncbi:MAG: FimV/HubP family polar landmark protein [Candidatus Berkiella sp.]
MTKLFSTIASSLAFALVPVVAYAIGLGNIVLHSHLNEPLDAEIALKDLKGVEPNDVIATVADQQAYEEAGLQPIGWLTSIMFQVVKDEVAGRPVLKLVTKDVVKDPFVDLLIEVKWPGGRLLREYTLLLDPPKSVIPSIKTIQKKQKIIPVIGAHTEKKIRKEEFPDTCQPNMTRHVETMPGGTYGPISDESLWSIAKSLSLNTHSNVHQAVMAIAEKNPHAFRDGNINYMLSGAVLKLPDKAELESYSIEQSQYYIAMQGQTPHHEPRKAPSMHIATASVKPLSPKPQKALKLVAPVQSLSSAAKVNADAPVKTENQTVLSERLTLIEEAIDTLKRNNEDMTRKNLSLQNQNQSLEKLLSMKDDEIKKLVDMVKQPNTTQTVENTQGQFAVAVSDLPQKSAQVGLDEPMLAQMAPPKAPEPNPNQAPVPPATPEQKELKGANEQLVVPNLAENEVKPNTIKVDNIASHSQPQNKVITADDTSVSAPQKASVTNDLEKPTSNSLLLFLLLSLSAMLLVLAWFRRNVILAFVEASLQGLFTKSEPVAALGSGQEVANYGMHFDLDRALDAISAQEKKFKKTGQTAKIIKESFDSEGTFEAKFADVEECISYERFGQAEKILKEILQQKPDEWVAIYKLLELYVLTEKYNEFIRMFEGLSEDLKDISPRIWSKIETLRQKVTNESVRVPTHERQHEAPNANVIAPTKVSKERKPLELEPIPNPNEQSLKMPEVEESYEPKTAPQAVESDSINIDALPSVNLASKEDPKLANNTQDIQRAQIALAKAYIDMGEFADAKELLNDLKKEASGDYLQQIEALLESIS